MLIELHVEDFDKAQEFYGRLGFKVEWERPPDGYKGYLVMSYESNTLCFWGGNRDVYSNRYFAQFPSTTKKGYGVEIILMVADLGEVYAKAKQFANIVEDMELRPWGIYDFRIEDPFGFYVRITTIHDIHDPRYAVK